MSNFKEYFVGFKYDSSVKKRDTCACYHRTLLSVGKAVHVRVDMSRAISARGCQDTATSCHMSLPLVPPHGQRRLNLGKSQRGRELGPRVPRASFEVTSHLAASQCLQRTLSAPQFHSLIHTFKYLHKLQDTGYRFLFFQIVIYFLLPLSVDIMVMICIKLIIN